MSIIPFCLLSEKPPKDSLHAPSAGTLGGRLGSSSLFFVSSCSGSGSASPSFFSPSPYLIRLILKTTSLLLYSLHSLTYLRGGGWWRRLDLGSEGVEVEETPVIEGDGEDVVDVQLHHEGHIGDLHVGPSSLAELHCGALPCCL